jgi:thioredoxin-like negative regulator of GroEL
MQQIQTNELKEKIKSGENFVLDLYATWCGPCKILMKTLNDVEEDIKKKSITEPKFKFYKFDIESDKEFVVQELGIRSVPTLKIFSEGKEIFSRPGIMSSNQIIDLLEK